MEAQNITRATHMHTTKKCTHTHTHPHIDGKEAGNDHTNIHRVEKYVERAKKAISYT